MLSDDDIRQLLEFFGTDAVSRGDGNITLTLLKPGKRLLLTIDTHEVAECTWSTSIDVSVQDIVVEHKV